MTRSKRRKALDALMKGKGKGKGKGVKVKAVGALQPVVIPRIKAKTKAKAKASVVAQRTSIKKDELSDGPVVRDNLCVWVSKLPPSVRTKHDVGKVLEKEFGPVTHVHLVAPKQLGGHPIFGFVRFASLASAAAAVRRGTVNIGGSAVLLKNGATDSKAAPYPVKLAVAPGKRPSKHIGPSCANRQDILADEDDDVDVTVELDENEGCEEAEYEEASEKAPEEPSDAVEPEAENIPPIDAVRWTGIMISVASNAGAGGFDDAYVRPRVEADLARADSIPFDDAGVDLVGPHGALLPGEAVRALDLQDGDELLLSVERLSPLERILRLPKVLEVLDLVRPEEAPPRVWRRLRGKVLICGGSSSRIHGVLKSAVDLDFHGITAEDDVSWVREPVFVSNTLVQKFGFPEIGTEIEATVLARPPISKEGRRGQAVDLLSFETVKSASVEENDKLDVGDLNVEARPAKKPKVAGMVLPVAKMRGRGGGGTPVPSARAASLAPSTKSAASSSSQPPDASAHETLPTPTTKPLPRPLKPVSKAMSSVPPRPSQAPHIGSPAPAVDTYVTAGSHISVSGATSNLSSCTVDTSSDVGSSVVCVGSSGSATCDSGNSSLGGANASATIFGDGSSGATRSASGIFGSRPALPRRTVGVLPKPLERSPKRSTVLPKPLERSPKRSAVLPKPVERSPNRSTEVGKPPLPRLHRDGRRRSKTPLRRCFPQSVRRDRPKSPEIQLRSRAFVSS
eukprot:TRINITY_DN3863_c0_g1_i1.p1 TRINITY_DN3863_c0_g1~~TRINITY_DN3863_c0_g1_i1.p1  ORF type:complete len:738 (-),score=151.54 TRINITY_DN3863_c0_g1_i1:22-2235(-)